MSRNMVLRRFGVSMESELLGKFDKLVSRKQYQTRSEAIGDLVRGALVEETLADQDPNTDSIATVSMVYNHHIPKLTSRLTEIQHDALDLIASTLHVHLDEDRCLEVLVVRGPYGRVRQLADKLITIKGVTHGKFVATTGSTRSTVKHAGKHAHHSNSKAAAVR
jgi:CopG family transcriptional regulator, nickel-responsive regulator